MLLVLTNTLLSSTSSSTFRIDCESVNIKHKDNLIVLTFSNNFSIAKSSEFVIKGNQAIVKVDKSNLKQDLELPDDFSKLKTQITRTDNSITLDQIKSIEISGNIVFIGKKDRVKVTASGIKSVDGARTFNIYNPRFVRTALASQQLTVKASETVLDTKTKTIKLSGGCSIHYSDKDVSSSISAPSVVYNYSNSRIGAKNCTGTITQKLSIAKFSGSSVVYSLSSHIGEFNGLSKFDYTDSKITVALTAKTVNYSPDVLRATGVSKLILKTNSNDTITTSSNSIIYKSSLSVINLGKDSRVAWVNPDQPELELISDSISIDVKKLQLQSSSRSTFVFNKTYILTANSSNYSHRNGSGLFTGNVEINEPGSTAIVCDKVRFSLTKGKKRIEIENLKGAQIEFKD